MVVTSDSQTGSDLAATVIICTCNRAGLLERVLKSLAMQTIPRSRVEVIVVDDGSSDDTPVVCREWCARMGNMRCISAVTNGGLARARNIGVRAARSDRLLFIDDDCIAASDWVARMTAALDREPMVGGAVASPRTPVSKLAHNISTFHGFMPGGKPGARMLVAGANMGFRKQVIEALGGFDETRRCAEDMEFSLRAREQGYTPSFVPDAIVEHDPSRIGMRAALCYAASHGGVTIHLRQRYSKLLRTPFILKSPLLLTVASPLIAFGTTAGIYASNGRLAALFWTAPLVFATKVAWCIGAARGLNREKRKEGGT